MYVGDYVNGIDVLDVD